MKIDPRPLAIWILVTILSFMMLITMLSSCSDARLAQKHYKKAVKYGYRCDTTSDTITIEKVDSFPILQNDTIVWRYYITKHDTIIKYKTSYVPKTKWQTRIEYKHDRKRYNALLKHNRYIVSQSQKEAVKMAKIDKRKSPLNQLKGLIVWGVVLLILFIVLNWLKK